MSDLFQFPVELREQIVNKLEWKSYFRLQQTCKSMGEFIRTNRNVKIFLPESLVITRDERVLLDYFVKNRIDSNLDLANLYGVRFDEICITTGINKTYPNGLSDFFNTNRITTSYLNTSYAKDKLPKEVYEKFLTTLKPVRIVLNGKSDIWDTLFQAKHLKDVSILTTLEDTEGPGIMETFMEKFHKLRFLVYGDERSSFTAIFHKILQYLCFQPLKNLHSFSYLAQHGCDDTTDDWRASVEMFIDQLRHFNPIRLETNGNDIDVIEFECRIGLDDRVCTLRICNGYMNLQCHAIFMLGE